MLEFLSGLSKLLPEKTQTAPQKKLSQVASLTLLSLPPIFLPFLDNFKVLLSSFKEPSSQKEAERWWVSLGSL